MKRPNYSRNTGRIFSDVEREILRGKNLEGLGKSRSKYDVAKYGLVHRKINQLPTIVSEFTSDLITLKQCEDSTLVGSEVIKKISSILCYRLFELEVDSYRKDILDHIDTMAKDLNRPQKKIAQDLKEIDPRPNKCVLPITEQINIFKMEYNSALQFFSLLGTLKIPPEDLNEVKWCAPSKIAGQRKEMAFTEPYRYCINYYCTLNKKDIKRGTNHAKIFISFDIFVYLYTKYQKESKSMFDRLLVKFKLEKADVDTITKNVEFKKAWEDVLNAKTHIPLATSPSELNKFIRKRGYAFKNSAKYIKKLCKSLCDTKFLCCDGHKGNRFYINHKNQDKRIFILGIYASQGSVRHSAPDWAVINSGPEEIARYIQYKSAN